MKKRNTIMENLKNKSLKVVRVDKHEFELDNGDIYPIPFELDVDEDISVEEYPFTKHKDFEKQIPICPDCNRQLTELNDIEWFCDNFECPNENIFKYNGTVLEQEKSPFTKVYFGVEVKNNKRISAIGARLNVENSKIKNDFQKESEIETIYNTITKTSKAGFRNVYIKDINISDEIKSILEKDGFLIKTNYSRGFEIKWDNETDKSVSLSEELKKQL